MGQSRHCGCPAESLASVYSVQALRGFVLLAASRGWGPSRCWPVLGLDEKDEVYRAGVDLEALFSEGLAERVGVRRGTVV